MHSKNEETRVSHILKLHTMCCYPIFDPCFDTFSEKSKNTKKQRKSKKYIFNIFASFLAFSTSSKKEFKFLKVFRMRSTFHASFFKIIDFSH